MLSKLSIIIADFLVIFCFFNTSLTAQQPGGVSGTKAWFITERVKIGSNDMIYLADVSGHEWKRLTGFRNTKKRNINFHEAFYLETSDIETGNPLKNFGFNQGTVLGMFFPNKSFDEQKALFKIENPILNVEMTSRQIDTGKKYDLKFKLGTNVFLRPVDRESAHYLSFRPVSYSRALPERSFSIWGEERQVKLFSEFDGYLPELIVYTRVLSSSELLQVQSYLALKYGSTLDTSYLNSKNEVIWDFNDAKIKPFHHRVTGIAKDTLAGLKQYKANSSYEPSKQYSSFDKNSYYDGLNSVNNVFIPAADSPSLYRSETFSFSQIASVPDSTYYMFGDNDTEIKADDFFQLDTAKKIEIVKRIWLAHDIKNESIPLKIMLAGKAYNKNSRSKGITVFEKIYLPYDYQFYRYFLIKLKSPSIQDTAQCILNTYFGREQSNQPADLHFSTRYIVWDSVIFNHPSGYNYFTFGRVPLLSFWEVGKFESGVYKKIELDYIYDRQLPLTLFTKFDTVITKFKNGDSIQFKASLGAEEPKVRYRLDSLGATWLNVDEVIISNDPDSSIDQPQSGETLIPPSITTDDNDSSVDNEDSEEHISKNLRFIRKQKWNSRKKLPFKYYKIRGLRTDSSYVIEMTDTYGQKSELHISLKSFNQ